MPETSTDTFHSALVVLEELSEACVDVGVQNAESDVERAANGNAGSRPPPTEFSVDELLAATKEFMPLLESICEESRVGESGPNGGKRSPADRLIQDHPRDVQRLRTQIEIASSLIRDIRWSLKPPGCCARFCGPSPAAAASAAAEIGRRSRSLARDLHATSIALRAATAPIASLSSDASRFGAGVLCALETSFAAAVKSVQGAVQTSQISVAKSVITGGASRLVAQVL
jgi:hypothetical protein